MLPTVWYKQRHEQQLSEPVSVLLAFREDPCVTCCAWQMRGVVLSHADRGPGCRAPWDHQQCCWTGCDAGSGGVQHCAG